MTEASKGLIEKSFKLDGLKKYLGTLNENAYRFAFNDENFSMFPLFYLADKYFEDIYETENETISFLFKKKPENGNRIKALVSVLQNESAWTNIFAFNIFTEATNAIEINAGTVVPYSASEIAWSLINLAGIEGALTLPVKADVLAYIKASLSEDGWDMPPLFLMFKNIEDMFDNQEYIDSVKNILGHLSIEDIVKLESFEGLGIDNRPDLQNYLTRNQVMCNEIEDKYNKMMFDWTTAIRGE